MPRLEHAIGGHSVRNEIKSDAGVAANVYAEYAPRENQFTRRMPRFMAATHGFRRLPGTETLPPVTGLEGSHEEAERLISANGREIRAYTNQSGGSSSWRSALTLTGHTGQRLRPVLGAARVGVFTYYVRDDGAIWLKVDGPSSARALLPPGAIGQHALGLACTPNGAGTEAARLWFTCIEDRRIRCWRASGGGTFTRDAAHDLDLSDDAVGAPESLWMGADNRLLIVDATAARVMEYSWDPDAAAPWTRITPPGPANPLSIQNIAGDPDVREPVVLGGVISFGDEIRVLDRTTGDLIRMERSTGAFLGRRSLPDLKDGETAAKAGCGFVNGQTTASRLYVNGIQYADKMGRFFGDAAKVPGIALPDGERPRPAPTPLVPMGDDGRLMGWVADRRLHLIDLRRDRVIVNVEGAVDSLAYDRGRFLAADASIGMFKVSPVNQARSGGDLYGQPEPDALLSIPGWPRDAPRKITGLFVGVRSVLARMDDDGLWRYARGNLEAAPVKISGSARVVGVCAAGDRVAVIEGSTTHTNTITVKLFDAPPATAADYGRPSSTHVVNPNRAYREATGYAADDTRLYVATGQSRLEVRLFTGAQVSGLSIDDSDDDDLFDGLTLPNTGWLRGMTFRGGHLLMALRQDDTITSNRTHIRAYDPGTGAEWSRAAGRDLTNEAVTDNAILAHDAQYVFDAPGEMARGELDDGTPARFLAAGAWLAAAADRASRYQWSGRQRQRTGARAVAVSRSVVYVWNRAGMEIRDLADDTSGFPYELIDTRTIGLAAPRSIALVADVLYWVGATAGGGLRVWRVGHGGDTVPEAVEGKTSEEMLERMAATDTPFGDALRDSVAWADDHGGHPAYVLHSERGGISLAYGADEEAWHVRTSRLAQAGGVNLDPLITWPWLRAGNLTPNDQGAQRVTHSTTWRGRLICGGFDVDQNGVLAFADADDFRDIDQGPVRRIRQFSGGLAERRLVRYPALRIDCAYAQGGGSVVAGILPRFKLFLSDDGGVTWEFVDEADFGPKGIGDPPDPFYRLGSSRDRVYRVETEAPVNFTLYGAYHEGPQGRVSGKI